MLNRRRGLASVLAAAVAILAAGCGVPLQDDPALLQSSPGPSARTSAPAGMHDVRVYMVRDGRLAPATRSTDDTSVRSLIEILAEGPTGSEEREGTTTALAPGDFVVEQAPSRGGPGVSVIINVPAQFTQIDGELQLLATAQLVWTATEPRPRGLVRMTFKGAPIELPTDRGLTSGPVRRSDFSSVAPDKSSIESPDAESP